MLGRFINFLLVIPHTRYLNTVGDYGDITTIYAFMAFFNILLSYGLETTYFKFIRNGHPAHNIYATAQKSLFASTLAFALVTLLLSEQAAAFMGYPGMKDYVYICLIFLVFDTLSIMPFARLRQEEKPLKFATIKLTNILVNVGLNLWVLMSPPAFLHGMNQVSLVLIVNAAASLASFLLLSPWVFDVRSPFDSEIYKAMLKYAWPLIFVGLAGMVNETLDRTLLKRLLPPSQGSYQNGIYGAFYKLTMVMTMFVQAYRFAAEPLFFKQKDGQESNRLYADTMYWFIGVCAFIFLACMFFIDPLAHLFIRREDYFADENGFYIVPILLMANMFLGIYYNLSIWYRLTDNTRKGAVISILGALITIASNVLFIPRYGFVACAWTTLGVYFVMCLISYFWGKHYMPIPYAVLKYGLLILTSLGMWLLGTYINCQIHVKWLEFVINLVLLSLMLLIIWMLQPKLKNA